MLSQFSNPLWLGLLSLATYRLTILLTKDDGPAWFIRKFRRWVKRATPKEAHLGEGVECPWCASLWFAPVCALTNYFLFENAVYDIIIIISLALSGAALIMNQLFTKD